MPIKNTRIGFVTDLDIERLNRADEKRRRKAGAEPSQTIHNSLSQGNETMESCGNCKFWLRAVDEKGEPATDGSGICRRYPPQPMMTHWVGQAPGVLAKPNQPPQTMYSAVNLGSAFPTMSDAGYCGEHLPSPDSVH